MIQPFHELTRAGKLRQLYGVAKAAVDMYEVDAAEVRLISTHTNFIYRVRTRDGMRYALRVGFPGWRTRENSIAETMWLDALARDTEIPVPRVIRTPNGDAVLSVTTPFVPTHYNVVMTSWLPGMLLGKHLTPQNCEKMGALFAQLHIHSASWQPPPGFPTQRFDRYLSRGEEERIFQSDTLNALSQTHTDTLLATRKEVSFAYHSFDQADLRVIHCDLWHDNIKVHRGTLAPFDFEDTIWGFRLHDLAMALLDLEEDASPNIYPRLLDAFQHGYTRHLSWPEGNLVTLQHGRRLWRLNWVARFQPDALPDAVAAAVTKFEKSIH